MNVLITKEKFLELLNIAIKQQEEKEKKQQEYNDNKQIAEFVNKFNEAAEGASQARSRDIYLEDNGFLSNKAVVNYMSNMKDFKLDKEYKEYIRGLKFIVRD
jgi:hypothetical protein